MHQKFNKYLDDTKLALIGLKVAFRRPSVIITTILVAIAFSYILTFFEDGTSNWALLWSNISIADKSSLLARNFLYIFEHFDDLYCILITLLSVFQGISTALLIYTWRHRAKDRHVQAQSNATATNALGSGAFGTAFGFLALGCPHCGISLLAPFLTTLAGTGSLALADILGWVFLILSFVFLLHTIRRLSYNVFIIQSAKNHQEHHL